MPLYEYTCGVGHPTEEYRQMENRDAAIQCASCGLPTTRRLSRVQTPVVRAAGYRLSPGDKGYWDFATPQGRLAPHERRQIAPDVAAEAYAKSPPTAVDPSSPVLI